MPTPIIPTGLRPLQSPYSFEGPGGVHNTEVSGGMPRVAMEYDRGVQAFRVTLLLTPAQFAIWTTFFHHRIKKGAISFQMTLDSGYGPDLHTVTMIGGSYSAARASNKVSTGVTFGVWAESQAYAMSSEDANALLDFYEGYGEAGSEVLERLAQFATVDTLVLA